jgi:FtsZ-binding cell division protein ZapB
MVAGLAYHLSKKIPGALDRAQMLKMEYEELWQQAADEDREKASLRIAPRQMFY